VDVRDVAREWHNTVNLFVTSRKVRVLRMMSREFCEVFRAIWRRRFGLVFIDKNHQDESVEHDTRFADQLSAGGMIVFHGYQSTRFPGIRRIVNAWGRDWLGRFVHIPAAGSIDAFRQVGNCRRSSTLRHN